MEAARATAAEANRFAGVMFGQLARAEEGNFVVSPFSIHSCMAMVAAGAAGDTESQMNATLGLAADRTARNLGLNALRGRLDALGAKGDVTLEVANRVWVQKSYPLLPAFTANVESTFGAGFAAADFVARADGERKAINGWVEDRTRSRIKDLIPPRLLGPDTRMVLVNAVYFYGAWQTPFPADRTEAAPFHVSPGRDAQVDLMQAHLDHLGYREEPGLQVCELPYRGRDLSMVVLLPPAGQLGALEARLAREGLDPVAGRLRPRTVNVALPRFRIEAQFGLNDPLIALGMRDAFSPGRADFSGMTGTRDLFVSAVVHKAFIEVNEKGTEAAAATGAVMTLTAMPVAEEPAVFRADRPFLFALRDRTSGVVLFLGRVAQPGK
jgi:serpin B